MGPASEATREILWNISHAWILYVLLIVSLVVFALGACRRIQSWKKGKGDHERFSDLSKRFFLMVREVLLQNRVRQTGFPALFHSFIFYSLLVLVLTTAVIALDVDFGTSLFRGHLYLTLTVAAEMAGVLMLFGVLMACWRRYIKRPETLETTFADTWALLLLAIIVVTGFAAEGIRIGVAGDRWQGFSPVGSAVSLLFSGLDPGTGTALHAVVWWIHTGLVFLWIATIPYTKFVHILTLPTNAFLSKLKPAGALDRVDLDALIESDDFDEEDFNIGIDTTGDFTWKQRLDLDACVSCGRCEEVCPAFLAKQPLSPKKFIAGMKELVRKEEGRGDTSDGATEIVGSAFDQGFVWYCLTCMACTRACPAFIPHVDTLVEVRRNEISMKGRADADVSRVIRSMEVNGNPFGSQIKRVDWVKSLGVPVAEEGSACEVLYWIGCLTTFDEDKQAIATDLVRILERCGVDFRVLGKAEACCGDPARVCGAEHLFQTIAKKQVEELNKREFGTLLVSCPHCYNVLKNEYPQFGGKYNVVHHSEFLLGLVQAGKLKPGKEDHGSTVYHDPCYLGRYQGIYDAPRQVTRAALNGRLAEMENCREKSRCCGGGGGHFWMDPREGERINVLRIEEARLANASTVATSCPYCLHMLRDAVKIKRLDKEIRIQDITSLCGHRISLE
jgi:Fe-S oxidoreductase/nitrate reductase gamma subunit